MNYCADGTILETGQTYLISVPRNFQNTFGSYHMQVVRCDEVDSSNGCLKLGEGSNSWIRSAWLIKVNMGILKGQAQKDAAEAVIRTLVGDIAKDRVQEELKTTILSVIEAENEAMRQADSPITEKKSFWPKFVIASLGISGSATLGALLLYAIQRMV